MDLSKLYQAKAKPLLFLLLIIVIFLIYNEYFRTKEVTETRVTVQEVINGLSAEKLLLSEKTLSNNNDYMIRQKMPKLFVFSHSKSELMIYEFNSAADRIDGQHIWEQRGVDNGYDLFIGNKPLIFGVYNTLLVYYPDERHNQPDREDIVLEFAGLQKTAYYLNGGVEKVLAGNSKNWQATVTTKSYEHQLNDKSGSLYLDTYSTSTGILTYIGSDRNDLKMADYIITTDISQTKANNVRPDQNGNFRLNVCSGCSITQLTEVIITVNWNGQEELINLRSEL